MSMTNPLISVESATPINHRIFRALWAANRLTYNPRITGVAAGSRSATICGEIGAPTAPFATATPAGDDASRVGDAGDAATAATRCSGAGVPAGLSLCSDAAVQAARRTATTNEPRRR